MVMESGLVKVLDFGLARGARADNLAEQVDAADAGRNGPGHGAYMSPEQVEARPIDQRSDIFSFGIVMYEMPRDRGHSRAIRRVIDAVDRQRSSARSRGDPARSSQGVAQLIGRCLEKNPRDRVQTTQEILIELKAHRRAWESGVSSKPSTVVGQDAGVRRDRFRIAVLPFQSRTAGSDAEALADGLTDDITAGLARFPYLRVVSRPDAEAAKGKAATPGGGAGRRTISAGRRRADGGHRDARQVRA